MRFEAVGLSDVGLVRTNNEDAWAVGERLLVVSDGVGGRPAGEVASTVAVTMLRHAAAAGVPVEQAIEAASRAVSDLGASNPLFTGMCCTATAAVATDGGALIAHIGDSKAWCVSAGEATRITEDQTITARMVRDGELTPEEAEVHPKRATLYQVVGSAKPLEVALYPLALAAGDRLVLATDGLDYAGDSIDELLVAPYDAEKLASVLVAAALEGGGNDNVTVVVADLVDGPD